MDHLETLQQRRANGAADGTDRVGDRREGGARHHRQDALQVRRLIDGIVVIFECSSSTHFTFGYFPLL